METRRFALFGSSMALAIAMSALPAFAGTPLPPDVVPELLPNGNVPPAHVTASDLRGNVPPEEQTSRESLVQKAIDARSKELLAPVLQRLAARRRALGLSGSQHPP